jgi:hypothetical protein
MVENTGYVSINFYLMEFYVALERGCQLFFPMLSIRVLLAACRPQFLWHEAQDSGAEELN